MKSVSSTAACRSQSCAGAPTSTHWRRPQTRQRTFPNEFALGSCTHNPRMAHMVATTSTTSVLSGEVFRDAESFSLIQGGPLFQLFLRAHLSDDALQLLLRRIFVISMLASFP